LYPSLHHPREAPHRFDEEQVRALALEWQCDQRTELLNEILLRAQPLITGVLLSRSKQTEDFDELLGLTRIRIWKKLPQYDSAQGRIYTYLTMICHQAVDELVAKRKRYQERYVPTRRSTFTLLARLTPA
jgi:DNA-directed RNA polymerase specialized sigma24 family protein